MRLLVLQHVPFEGPAAIASWAEARGHSLDYLDCSQSPVYPSATAYDAVVILGGPMGVNDELPWMEHEIAFIKSFIDSGKMLLGVCLGAQMIAAALGAKVRKSPHREIGWFPVTITKEALNNPLTRELPKKLEPLHWHGDTFDLPQNAVHLYRSDACENQAFLIDDRIVGLQFHLEFDETTTRRVAEACENELAAGGEYIQSLGEILADPAHFYNGHNLLFELLDRFFLRIPIVSPK